MKVKYIVFWPALICLWLFVSVVTLEHANAPSEGPPVATPAVVTTSFSAPIKISNYFLITNNTTAPSEYDLKPYPNLTLADVSLEVPRACVMLENAPNLIQYVRLSEFVSPLDHRFSS